MSATDDWFDKLDSLPYYVDKPEERPGTEPAYRWDNSSLPSGDTSKRFRYYLELPNSKGDMARDILFDMSVAELLIDGKFYVYNFKAEYSYFYGDEKTRGSSCYRCYEWEGSVYCAKTANEERTSAAEEYNQLSDGMIFIDPRRSMSDMNNEISDMQKAITKSRSYERLQDIIFGHLDSLGLRSYEDERPAKRHCYSRHAVTNRWRLEKNREIAAIRRPYNVKWPVMFAKSCIEDAMWKPPTGYSN